MSRNVTRDWPRFLGALGYVTLSVDSYRPRGFRACNEVRTDYSRPGTHDPVRRIVALDAYGALDYLAAQRYVDGNRVAVMGFSSGANSINYNILPGLARAAGGRDFKAAIGLYGRCNHLFGYSQDAMPAMQIVGERDKFAPICAQAGGASAVEAHILPSAYHAFDNGQIRRLTADPFGNTMLYSATAVGQARELTEAFLARHLAN